MNIFGCCPKKPKMTLDYVIKWVEETDKTLKEVVAWKQEIEEDDLKSLFDEYASSYPWGEVPAFDAKADKVENATTGDFAALNGAGNITDSGYKASSFAPATHYHTLLRLASQREPSEYNQIALGEQEQQGVISIRLYDASVDDSVFSDVITASQLNNIFYPATAPVQGNQKLITSSAVFTALQGKADSEHYHSTITNQASGGRVALFEVDATSKTAILELNDGTIYKSAEINMNNIDNLNRALETPATQPASGSNKLITSGAVYNYIPRAISNAGYGVSADEDGEISIGSDYVVISVDGGGEAEINSENIANLNRALTDPVKASDLQPVYNDNKLITSKAVYDALLGKMGALKEIFIDCDDSGSSDTWEIRPDSGEAAFEDALVWGDTAPRLIIVNITKGTFGTTNLKTYRTIGSIHATAVEVNVDSYDLTAEIYVDGRVFTRTGQEVRQETTWAQGITLEADDIFTHVSNS